MTSIPLRSMTGYGEAEREWEQGTVRIELRSVNHRHLAVQLRLPPSIERHGSKIERALRESFARGQLNVSVALGRLTAGGDAAPIHADVERARGYVEALRTLQRELGLDGKLDVSVLARFRDLFREEDSVEGRPEVPEDVLMEALEEAAKGLRAMREEEGAALALDLSGRIAAMDAQLAEVEVLAPVRLVAERDRLRAAIAKLLDGDVSVDEERIAREVAHLAERWDIHEEIVRFRSHIALFRETLRAGAPDGVGKRLGFVAQELLREANTIGSKANDAEIARRVVSLKEEIDRVREQVENVE
jgi:uncharacterized protein (TIGR00255 family)